MSIAINLAKIPFRHGPVAVQERVTEIVQEAFAQRDALAVARNVEKEKETEEEKQEQEQENEDSKDQNEEGKATSTDNKNNSSNNKIITTTTVVRKIMSNMDEIEEFLSLALEGDLPDGEDKKEENEEEEEDSGKLGAWFSEYGDIIGYGDMRSCGNGKHGWQGGDEEEEGMKEFTNKNTF